MANYKSEYEKVRKATSEATSLLSVEELITKELNIQKTIRDELNSVIKKSIDFLIPPLKSYKTMQEKVGRLESNTRNKLLKSQQRVVDLDKAWIAQGAKKTTRLFKELKLEQSKVGLYQSQLAKITSIQAKAAAALKPISTAWAVIGAAIFLALGYFKEFDEEASRFRIRMGVLRDDVQMMEKSLYKSWKSLANVNVTMKDLTASIEALTSSFGTMWSASDDIRDNVAVWQTQLGVSAKSGAELLRVFSQLDGSTAQSQLNMGNFLTRMTAAAGVPLNETMEDIANSSKTAYSMMARNPLAIAKAAVEARRLGTTLDAIAKSGKSLLNFTDSINAEMNASVLVGKSLNLQRARELAYRRDLEGLNKEIVRLARDEVNFNKLDYFQQEAFAAALGKSVDEVAKILQAEKQTNWIRANGTAEMKRQLNNLEAMKKVNDDLANDIGKQAAETLKTQANQSKLTALSNAWKQVLMEIVSIFVPMISVLLSIALVILKVLKPVIVIAGWVLMVWQGFVLIKAAVLAIGAAFAWPVLLIAAVVAGLILIGYHCKGIRNWIVDIGKSIKDGIVSAGNDLYDALIKPFLDELAWIG